MIDLIYLNESKRIRKEYLENLAYIVKNEDVINFHINEINNIKDILNDSPDSNKDEFINQLKIMDENLQKISKHIQKYYDNIKQLDVDQRKLYYNIKDKYPNISDDDIKNEIIEFIEPVNNEFIKNNNEIYNKINIKHNNYE